MRAVCVNFLGAAGCVTGQKSAVCRLLLNNLTQELKIFLAYDVKVRTLDTKQTLESWRFNDVTGFIAKGSKGTVLNLQTAAWIDVSDDEDDDHDDRRRSVTRSAALVDRHVSLPDHRGVFGNLGPEKLAECAG